MDKRTLYIRFFDDKDCQIPFASDKVPLPYSPLNDAPDLVERIVNWMSGNQNGKVDFVWL